MNLVKLKSPFILLLASVLLIGISIMMTGCRKEDKQEDGKIKIVTTTTMLGDLTSIIGKDAVSVSYLMGPGIDPHLYQASAGDVIKLQTADIVVYNGLHLEGKMGDVFGSLENVGVSVICIEDGLDQSKILESEDDASVPDPHIWFDVSLWREAAIHVATSLSKEDPEHSSYYEENLKNYLVELDELDQYISGRVSELPESQRVLVTAHDAFRYFGKAYGVEVKGLQGISTNAEAGTGDMSQLASFIAEREIKAIFVESSVPPKMIEALQVAVKAKGFRVEIGGELYSDSLGDEQSGADSYILTLKANIDTIIDALN